MAYSVGAAMAIIDSLAELDGALLDGNIERGTRDGSDGAKLALYIRTKFPHAFIISISGNSQSWSDYPDITGETHGRDIAELVTAI